MIDHKATKARFKETGRTVTGWARSRGFDAATMNAHIMGKVRLQQNELDALRADGLLVEKEECNYGQCQC